jgi:hypothetical protein
MIVSRLSVIPGVISYQAASEESGHAGLGRKHRSGKEM